jgi:ADP-ribose pyrophosphatase
MQKHKILEEHLVLCNYGGRLMDLTVEHPLSKDLKTYTVSYLPDWVNVIAETHDHKLVLVEQWRAGIDDMSIEIPGGKVDEEGETTPEIAIKEGLRELQEETGYVPTENSKIYYMGSVKTNPALQNNNMHFVFVNHVEKKEPTKFDEFELVYTHVYDKARISDYLKSGKINHAYTVIGLMKAMGT